MAYRFDPTILHRCAREAEALPIDQGIVAVTEALRSAYPTALRLPPSPWIFNNAGGAMGQIKILYASLGEYILLFGTPIGTEGHSGRYRSEVWDFMLTGEMWCYEEGDLERRRYVAGEVAHLRADSVKGYRIPDHAWMLEYSRGLIPSMLPFGLADTLTSTLDLQAATRTVWQYTRHVCGSLAGSFPLRK